MTMEKSLEHLSSKRALTKISIVSNVEVFGLLAEAGKL
jgi:hypothetical protein